eukprot:2665644-Rhodomonas_salina.1
MGVLQTHHSQTPTTTNNNNNNINNSMTRPTLRLVTNTAVDTHDLGTLVAIAMPDMLTLDLSSTTVYLTEYDLTARPWFTEPLAVGAATV